VLAGNCDRNHACADAERAFTSNSVIVSVSNARWSRSSKYQNPSAALPNHKTTTTQGQGEPARCTDTMKRLRRRTPGLKSFYIIPTVPVVTQVEALLPGSALQQPNERQSCNN
jgi:hypothetical protein